VSTRDAEATDFQRQLDDLAADVATNTARIGSLQDRVDAADARADAAESRADEAQERTEAMERRSRVDREMIAELYNDGILSRQHIDELEEALRTSRTIGAAIGMVMMSRQVAQDEAFAIIKRASQNGNRKLRDLAAELIATGSTAGVD